MTVAVRAILVLGAAVWPGGVPSPTLRRRIDHATAVWRAESPDWIVGAGGLGRHGPSEADVICARLAAQGLSPARLQREDRSTSTLENFLHARPILERLGVTQTIVITDGYHMRRALMTARALGISAEGRPVPHAAEMSPRAQTMAHLREALARPAYRWKLRRVRAGSR